MAYQVIIKKRFINKVRNVLSWLNKEWSAKVAGEFIEIIDYRIDLLCKQPYSGAPSLKVKDVRGLLITPHNKMYYKVKGSKVIILNMYDTRINPKKNPY